MTDCYIIPGTYWNRGLARTQSFELLVPWGLARTQSFHPVVPYVRTREDSVFSTSGALGTRKDSVISKFISALGTLGTR